jgi:hypothetical protein
MVVTTRLAAEMTSGHVRGGSLVAGALGVTDGVVVRLERN